MSTMLHRARLALNAVHAETRPLVVITGPTGSGKTGLSIDLALALGGAEVVNADSRQLYRFLDIGTAKITAAEQRGVPHHLLSVLDPRERVTIAWYRDAATKAIDDCHARGVIPLLVGGSMLYISALIDGLTPLPSDERLRAELQATYDRDAGKTLYAELLEFDPDAAVAIDPRNSVYLIRAIEICRLTGRPASAQRRKVGSPYHLHLFYLDIDTAVLHERIDSRTRSLLQSGWAEEVAALRERGYRRTDPGMMSHGYREILARLEAGASPDDLRSDEALSAEINAVTRQYARRQRTWWRQDERIERLMTQAAA